MIEHALGAIGIASAVAGTVYTLSKINDKILDKINKQENDSDNINETCASLKANHEPE